MILFIEMTTVCENASIENVDTWCVHKPLVELRRGVCSDTAVYIKHYPQLSSFHVSFLYVLLGITINLLKVKS